MENEVFMESSSLRRLFKGAKPYLGVCLLQFGFAGMAIIVKFALNMGMNHYTFVVYRHAIAAIVFLPFALLLERKVRPKMTLSIFAKIMLLGLLEPVIDQNLYYLGMTYTTATFASAMCNTLPALTFLMAWILRLEKVNVRRMQSQAKVAGTVVTLGGAMLMTLLKGPILEMVWNNKGRNHHQSTSVANYHQNPIKGALMITAGCFCWACFMNLQAITLKSYPAELSLTVMICIMGTVEGAVVALVAEWGNTAIWSIHFDAKFFAALYSGIICSGAAYFVQGKIMKERGPVFVTAFSPLSMVIVTIMGSIILGEQIYLGRVIGAVIIVTGLYVVIWGKSKDERRPSKLLNNDQVTPIDHHHDQPITGTTIKEEKDIEASINHDSKAAVLPADAAAV